MERLSSMLGLLGLLVVVAFPVVVNTLPVEKEKIAFSVTIDSNIGPFTTAEVVMWERALVDVGNGFNLHTGMFTAPVTGIYFFSLAVHKRPGGNAPFVYLYVDGQVKMTVDECCNDDSYDTGSNTILLPLTQGQSVWVELVQTRMMFANGSNALNTFTGFLLFD